MKIDQFACASSTDAAAFAARIGASMAPLACPEKASGMAAYMQGRFPFLGIQTPDRRQASRAAIQNFAGNPVAAAQILWKYPEREYQYVAVDLLRHHASHLGGHDLPALEALILDKSWWDTVDGLAVVIGGIVLADRPLVSRMDELIGAGNFWLRRVALLHQLGWKENTDEKRLFAYCLRCAHEKEFFIRKAIGWALRQYARCAPEAVGAFLDAHGKELSPLSRREAGKHLTA